MKIGLIGPSGGDIPLLSEAIEFLITEADVDQAIYLGRDDSIDKAVSTWAKSIMGESNHEESFFKRAALVAVNGSSQEIERLLEDDDAVKRLHCIRKLPPGHSRAVEMIEDRIITVVHDKSTLQEEDIANATLLVYGKSDQSLLKRFGPRYFFTPGPLSERKVAVIEAEADGQISVALYEPSGSPIWREALAGKSVARLTVST